MYLITRINVNAHGNLNISNILKFSVEILFVFHLCHFSILSFPDLFSVRQTQHRQTGRNRCVEDFVTTRMLIYKMCSIKNYSFFLSYILLLHVLFVTDE